MVSADLLGPLKPWIAQTLEPITDADLDALSDYVIALLSNDMTLDRLAVTCNEQLVDFLHGETEPFVQQLIAKVEQELNSGQTPQPASIPSQQLQRSNFRTGNKENVGFSSQNLNNEQNNQFTFDPTNNFNPQASQNPFPGFNPAMFPPPPVFGNGELPTPQQSGVFMPPFNLRKQQSGGRRGGRDGNRNFNHNNNNNNNNRRNGRSEYSEIGQDKDYAKKKLIVENLPEDKLDKTIITEYFSRFGTLTNVTVIFEKKLAELEFESHDQARSAWTSPDPIFNNRFVKVYWKKAQEGEEESIDLEAVKRIQAERQREFEEKEQKRKAHETQLKELLAAKTKIMLEQEALISSVKASGQLDNDPELQEKLNNTTAVLKRQLAELQREANSLGISDGGAAPTNSYRGARGGYRGGYRGRGGAFSPYSRGRGRGRAGHFVPSTRTNLDLRPKGVKFDLSPEKDEALRGYLSTLGGSYEDIARDKSSNEVTIAFSDRRSAEQFFYGPKEIPDVGEIKREWVQLIQTPPTPSGSTDMDTS